MGVGAMWQGALEAIFGWPTMRADGGRPLRGGAMPTSTWVSKTDMTRFLRCPYAFCLIDRGLITFEDTLTEQQIRIIQDGADFQSRVEAKAVPFPSDAHDRPAAHASKDDLPRVLTKGSELKRVFARESIRLIELPVFENPELEIYGRPDAIDTEKGALIPVEVKSHKEVLRTDILELAFYWMLLEPYRTRVISPCGYLLLRRDGVVEPVKVEIEPSRFGQVRALLTDVRGARENGVRPRICSCTVCLVKRDEIHRVAQINRDLSMIWDIGPARARILESVGINSYDELLNIDCASI